MRSPFGAPGPTPFEVRWDRSPDEVTTALAAAVRELRYVEPLGEPRPHYRLDGAVSGSAVRIRATPYVAPGLLARRGAVPLVVTGDIRAAHDGAGLDGWISAPIPGLQRWLLFTVALTLFVILVPAAGLPTWLILQGLFAAVAAVLLPLTQRRTIALRSDQVRRVLVVVVEQAAAQPAQLAERG